MKNGCLNISQAQNIANKRLVKEAMDAITDCKLEELEKVLQRSCSDKIDWRGSHPLNELSGIDSLVKTVWAPLKTSLPNMERRDEIIVGGRYRNRHGEEHDMVA